MPMYISFKVVNSTNIVFILFIRPNNSKRSYGEYETLLNKNRPKHCVMLCSGWSYDGKENTVVVKRQAEEVGKRVPDKLRAQENLKLKTRARLNKHDRKQKSKKTFESNYG